MPPPIPQPAPRQPANDLLGDLGGDPFAQPAGIVTIVATFTYVFLKEDFCMFCNKTNE